MKALPRILLWTIALTSIADAQSAAPQLALVSAADYSYTVAPASIVSIFAQNIAAIPIQAPNGTAPGTLGNVSATITDAAGTTLPISLLSVAPSQVNAVLPAPLQSGDASVALKTSAGIILKGAATISQVAPSIFTADQSGHWIAAAQVVVTHTNGTQTFINSIATCGAILLPTDNKNYLSPCAPTAIDLGSSSDTAVLVLFGTGIRNASQLIAAKCPKCGYDPVDVTIGQRCNSSICSGPLDLTVLYAGPQGGNAITSNGLDQINVSLPNWLAGSGLMPVNITVADLSGNIAMGADTNAISIYIR